MISVDPKEAGFDPARLAAVKAMMESDVESGQYDGIGLAVGRSGGLVSMEAAGFADRAEGLPMTTGQRVLPFSISKQFINVLILNFVERGLLSLGQPVAEILPAFGARGKGRIQLWHLLSHTSGCFSGLPPLGPEDLIQYQKWTEFVCQALPEAEPGTQVIYSLLGAHAVLSSLLVAVDPKRRPLAQILQEDLFDPVGMDSTTIGPPRNGEHVAPVKCRYRDDVPSGLFHGAEVEAIAGLVLFEGSEIPGGGFVTTVEDAWRFADMLRAGGITQSGVRILSPATLELAARNWTGDSPNSIFNYAVTQRNWLPWPGSVGLGFFVRDRAITPGPLPNLGSASTYGGWGSGSSLFWIDPVRDVSFAMVTTGVLEDTDHVQRSQKLSDMVLAALVD
ncbi:serine hydrolase domain-containing protein [Chachezhania sediminis]|uniref:serine hydrolase domain-containing protein n=1 Tax=Chachezhania sediminis TaxID=2599291 RepID=UPI00131C20AD|nr:serine hydrolase domain-containing protein [Chachezhania sediminis]